MLNDIAAQIVMTSAMEWVAVGLALAYVVLAARENMLCWFCAFVSTALYVWLFWRVTLPFQSLLNVFYMVMAIYGYWQWRPQATQVRRICVWPWWRHLLILPTGVIIAWTAATYAENYFNSEYLLLDALVQVFSVITTFMVAHKVLENWLYWGVINAAAAFLYFTAGLVVTAILFIGYLGFSIYGYLRWQRQYKEGGVNAA